ncbi:MAG: acyl--CoA ligase, partial [Acidimicrobiaceae bacterium]|nr:acyl--CoA ligase [Acidimicrobiaceae bacterium]
AVVDAAAFGVPSREWGEEVAVCVITRSPAPAADDLRELVRARLRSSRVPARVEFVDELPYNDTGKLLRRELRQRFASDSPGG